MKRIACTGFVFALSTVLMGSASAQSTAQPQDQSSLGDYARTVRKDTTPKAKPKVFDNDNLPKDDKLSVVGTPATADASDTSSPGAANKTAASTENKDAASNSSDEELARKQAAWKVWQEKLSGQKEQIDLATRELEVLQREYQIRAAAMYADVGNRMRNAAQWDKQDAEYKQKIADKQKALDDAKQKLEDMQEEARKAGVPAAMREP